jgi:hypothetical protein
LDVLEDGGRVDAQLRGLLVVRLEGGEQLPLELLLEPVLRLGQALLLAEAFEGIDQEGVPRRRTCRGCDRVHGRG